MASSRHVPGRVAALRRGLGFGLAAVLLSGAGLQGAAAQGFYRDLYGPPRAVYYDEDADLLPPREVVESLRDRGFSEIGRPRYDGRAYRVEATSPRGLRVRLVVDARDGDVIGREPLGGAYFPSARVRPVAPGYGWTEEDLHPRRQREAERIVPPADIPSVPTLRDAPFGVPRDGGRGARAERVPPALRPEANPLGVNPDASRRTARAAASPKLPSQTRPQARIAPPAPEPSLRPGQSGSEAMTPAAKSQSAPETKEAKGVEPKVDAPKVETGRAEPTKDSSQEPAKTADSAPASAEKKGWQDPPADGGRKVRVIGGATVVPGGSGEAGAN